MKKKKIMLYLLGVIYLLCMICSLGFFMDLYDYLPDFDLMTDSEINCLLVGFYFWPALVLPLGFSGFFVVLFRKIRSLKSKDKVADQEKTGH